MTTPFHFQNWDALRYTGPDAGTFLQGQLTGDVMSGNDIGLAGWCSSKGRLRALVIWIRDADGYWLLLPARIAAQTQAGLDMYRFRARVESSLAASAGLCVAGRILDSDTPLDAPTAMAWGPVPGSPALEIGVVRAEALATDASGECAWHRRALSDGLPQVYPETAERFLPQMLNLDLLDGVSFEKGCYVGQEVVARTQHLGRIKRRMFLYRGATRMSPGDEIFADGAAAGIVVDSAPDESGGHLILAVIRLAHGQSPLSGGKTGAHPLEAVPLPYEPDSA